MLPRRRAGVLLLVAALTTGCYATVVRAPGRTGATEGKGTSWSYLWGFREKHPDFGKKCKDTLFAEVRTSTNLGYMLFTFITLGFASPTRVQWSCTPEPTDSIIGLRLPRERV